MDQDRDWYGDKDWDKTGQGLGQGLDEGQGLDWDRD